MSEAADSAGKVAAKVAAASLRTCIATRKERSPEELIRFVVGPDDRIVPDVARALPGRGVWVTCSRIAVEQAVARKAFAQSLRRKVVVPPDLADRVQALLVRRAREAFSLANKAGLVTSGFVQVEAAISKGAVIALVHAAEAAPDGAAKLDRRYRAICRELGRTPAVLSELSSDQLSLAMGRPNVIHAALSAGGASDRILREMARIRNFRLCDGKSR